MGKVSVEDIRGFKGRERLPVLTAYDYPMAKLLDELEMPMMLVGDSLGMVVLGYPDTTQVTMEDMLHHVRAVARSEPSALIVADLPFESYETVETAVLNSQRLVDAGADAVKAEGAIRIEDQIRAITSKGIPFMGHIGMLPQHIKEEGRYRIKGKVDSEREFLQREALLLDEMGAFAVVLELVVSDMAKEITKATSYLTIGIGSGPECDGQILVSHDLVGGFPWFKPRFVKPKLNVSLSIKDAISEWQSEVRMSQTSEKE
ncbi:3-methyl-2-oxobutanoate hydroxymethyltransferase [Verrucomicrobia bacterium]|jgi:3-methyl-2-oxobutanoate hydroxymethyltransferase|nr:3-methyl-2-oxobutanoate hydroxymethyltransferase [bacterium]MDA7657905.1 3-methyl-2-oxobutanoate hydroxymethyltransferase [Verrucomicrobiota bacterium]MDA7867085.1 3-methyl-2-oxobutanoate hydroxymethyltransferase [Verrucomicrobiota bacterium]